VEINSLDDKYDRVVISVVQAPLLLPQSTSTDKTAVEGQPTDLICDATGIPMPTIEWSRQGRELLPTGKEKYVGKKLSIVRVKPDDRGFYRCTAFNDAGILHTDIFLEVQFQPILEPLHNELYQAIGYRIELQCLVKANPQPVSVQGYAMKWQLPNQRGLTRSTGRYTVNIIKFAFKRYLLELVINGVQEEDYGDYRCQAMNSLVTEWRSELIQLKKTNVPQRSLKVGRVIAAKSPGLCPSLWFTLIAALVVIIRTVCNSNSV
jgi:hypothetical protein